MFDHQRIQAVLSGHDLVHPVVARKQPDPAEPPVKSLALVHQLVKLRSLMSTMQAAHSTVDDPRAHPRTVVRRRRQGGGETGKRVGVQLAHGLFLGVRTGSVKGAGTDRLIQLLTSTSAWCRVWATSSPLWRSEPSNQSCAACGLLPKSMCRWISRSTRVFSSGNRNPASSMSGLTSPQPWD